MRKHFQNPAKGNFQLDRSKFLFGRLFKSATCNIFDYHRTLRHSFKRALTSSLRDRRLSNLYGECLVYWNFDFFSILFKKSFFHYCMLYICIVTSVRTCNFLFLTAPGVQWWAAPIQYFTGSLVQVYYDITTSFCQ